MKPTKAPRVKICCIGGADEARTAIRYGASALGLVSAMPSGPGVIDDEQIAEVALMAPIGVSSVLLTSLQDPEAIIAQQRRLGVNSLQIVDELPIDAYDIVRHELPGIGIMQVIHVTGPESVNLARSVAPYVNSILLDSGNPTLAVKELGGTGRVHDWTISQAIREQVDVPIFLAGGLTPENVAQAIHQVGPFGLDLCSSVRTDGLLDESKLGQFFSAVRAATSFS